MSNENEIYPGWELQRKIEKELTDYNSYHRCAPNDQEVRERREQFIMNIVDVLVQKGLLSEEEVMRCVDVF